MKYLEIIADNLKKAGWSWDCVENVDYEGRTIWSVDAHRDDGKRFVVRADELLTAFVELEAAIHSRRLGSQQESTWRCCYPCPCSLQRRDHLRE